tara:strand:- start:58 stop:432 length:375 start_codon:yes stop_codon:yes gene_type:complete
MTDGKYFHVTKADIMSQYAQRNGINGDTIVKEGNSYSTKDHPPNLKPIFDNLMVSDIVIVTERFHSKRAYKTFQHFFKNNKSLNLFMISADDGIDYQSWWKDHESTEKVAIEMLKTLYYELFIY